MHYGFDDEIQEMMPLKNNNLKPPKAPKVKRSLKDFAFLVLFGGGLYGYITLSTYGFAFGDPEIYIQGYDSWGNVCGREKNLVLSGVSLSGKNQSNNSFIFYMGLSNLKTALDPFRYIRSPDKPAVICVNQCPKNITDCRDLLRNSGYLLPESFIKQHICTMSFGLVLSHFEFLNRCIPKQLLQASFKSNKTSIVLNNTENEPTKGATILRRVPSSALSKGVFFLASFKRFWLDGLKLASVPIVLCIILALCLRFMSKIMILVMIFAFSLGSLFLTFFMWYSYFFIDKEFDEQSGPVIENVVSREPEVLYIIKKKINNTIYSQKLEQEEDIEQTIHEAMDSGFTLSDLQVETFKTNNLFKLLAIDGAEDSNSLLGWTLFFTFATIILLSVLIWMRKSFKLVINLFDEACKTSFGIPLIFIQPLITLVFLTFVCFHFFSLSVYLITILTPVVDGRGFVKYVKSNKTSVYGMLAGNLLGSLWLWEFASGCEQFIIAGSVSYWYFNRQKYKRFKCCPTFKPTCNLFRYSLGTIAIGSLVVTAVDYMKIFVYYINSKLQKHANAMSKKPAAAVMCCLHCMEKILRFANRNAYIFAAIHGTSFWESGKQGLALLLRNAEYTLVVNVMSFFFLFLAKCSVVVLTGILAFLYFKAKYGPQVTVSEYGFIIFLLCLFSYIVALCFFRVYDVILNTLFICFFDDRERNNGVESSFHSTKNWNKLMSTVIKKSEKKRYMTSMTLSDDDNDYWEKFSNRSEGIEEKSSKKLPKVEL